MLLKLQSNTNIFIDNSFIHFHATLLNLILFSQDVFQYLKFYTILHPFDKINKINI